MSLVNTKYWLHLYDNEYDAARHGTAGYFGCRKDAEADADYGIDFMQVSIIAIIKPSMPIFVLYRKKGYLGDIAKVLVGDRVGWMSMASCLKLKSLLPENVDG